MSVTRHTMYKNLIKCFARCMSVTCVGLVKCVLLSVRINGKEWKLWVARSVRSTLSSTRERAFGNKVLFCRVLVLFSGTRPNRWFTPGLDCSTCSYDVICYQVQTHGKLYAISKIYSSSILLIFQILLQIYFVYTSDWMNSDNLLTCMNR